MAPCFYHSVGRAGFITCVTGTLDILNSPDAMVQVGDGDLHSRRKAIERGPTTPISSTGVVYVCLGMCARVLFVCQVYIARL